MLFRRHSHFVKISLLRLSASFIPLSSRFSNHGIIRTIKTSGVPIAIVTRRTVNNSFISQTCLFTSSPFLDKIAVVHLCRKHHSEQSEWYANIIRVQSFCVLSHEKDIGLRL